MTYIFLQMQILFFISSHSTCFLLELSVFPSLYSKPQRAVNLKMKVHVATNLAQVEMPPFQPASESRIMGCGQKTSEELDTSHSSLEPINLALPPH